MNEKEFWLNAENLLLDLLEKSKDLLDVDSIEAVMHYINHSEYEMAFEGLFIELVKRNVIPAGIDWNKYRDLAIKFNLDKESVFDPDFWNKFSAYVTHAREF